MSATLTPAELAEIRQRAEAATPGPWNAPTDWSHYAVSSGSFRVVESANQNNAHDFTGRDLYGISRTRDAVFITHARTDIPALLAHIAEQDRVIADLRAAVEAAPCAGGCRFGISFSTQGNYSGTGEHARFCWKSRIGGGK